MANAVHHIFRVRGENRPVDFRTTAFDLFAAKRLDFDGSDFACLFDPESAFKLALIDNSGTLTASTFFVASPDGCPIDTRPNAGHHL
ncbi:hypothetical protein [Ruegeria lacuscaerulensis]|uniref:hypothetical protein n=1 Tax=Ruegeria lacuscaerulensis TaxID=55218 RepID=UPI00147AA86C|nr:hypothetical protein [Ruegeria lacuscaerulensis]